MKMATPCSGSPGPAPATPGGRRISWGLLFMFTIPPFPTGVNYMFMGLIKKGLAALCGFFLLIFLISITSGPLTWLLGLALPIYWLTCAFDGFNLRRRINAGEHVPDSIDEVLRAIRGNKYVLWAIIILVGLSVLGTVVGAVMGLIRWLMPLIVIGLGLYVLFRRRTPPSGPTE